VAGDLGGNVAQGAAHVGAEQAGRNRQGDHGEGQAARHDHQELGGEQPGGQAAPEASGDHVPGPMR